MKDIYENYKKFMNDRSDAKHARGDSQHYAPHCDSRVLHEPDKCQFCAMPDFDDVRKFRLENHILHTGEAPRSGWWACPAEYERGLKSVNGWAGNTAKPVGCNCGYWYDPENPCPVHNK